MTDRLLTIDEVAEYIRVPKKTLYRWRSKTNPKGPRAFKLPHGLRYRLSDVDEWLVSVRGPEQ